MLKANENDFSYRFGDNGPKYLIQGPILILALLSFNRARSFKTIIIRRAKRSFMH